jgi:hypothetical protein
MARSKRSHVLAVTLALSSLIVTSCGLVRSSQSLTVNMAEGSWSVDPAVVEDVNRLDFTFSNEGSEPHNPVVVVVPAGAGPVELGSLLEELMSFDSSGPSVIYPDEESGMRGHFHPGGPDEPDLPEVAFTAEEDGGETIRYLFTRTVDSGDSATASLTAGYPEFTFGDRHSGTTYVVLCMNQAHAHRVEMSTFELAP